VLSIIPIIASSLFLCLVLTPFFRDFFAVLGVVDRPDSHRKAHKHPIPRVGGVALASSYLVTLAALTIGWRRGLFNLEDPTILLMLKLLPAVILIFLTGLVDDIRGLSPWRKIAMECLAGGYACWVGVRLSVPVSYHGPAILIDLLSVFWLVLCANAFNLIDGLDGLATGIAVIASASLLIAALIHHNTGLALVITPFVGVLFGFLYYNFNPASIFLGDCGSLLVGFLLGCYGLMWNQHATTGLGRLAPIVAMAFPVAEVMLSIFRRFLRDRPVFGSDRNHIHHRIQILGLNQREAALALYGVSAIAAVIAVLQTILRPQPATVLLLMLLAVAYVGFRTLHYPEFGVLRRFLLSGQMRHALKTQIDLQDYRDTLDAAKTLDQCWTVLSNACMATGFHFVSLQLEGRYFEKRGEAKQVPEERRRAMALGRSGSVTFGYERGATGPATLIVPLTEMLEERLSELWITGERLKSSGAGAG
jgi:UDP-GlcNAc:undecaprenyl-phosphate GlcNAc-1-phosphate transferase